jgi:hypothetical protein
MSDPNGMLYSYKQTKGTKMAKNIALTLTTKDELFVDEFEIGNSYRLLSNAVGGMIECVGLRNNIDMWVNDNGIAENLPYNATATAIYWSNFGFMSGTIFGDVIFTSSDGMGETIGLTKEQGEYLREIAFDYLDIKPQKRTVVSVQKVSDLYGMV